MKKIALRFSEVAEAYMMRTLNEYLHDKIDEKIHMYVPSGRTNLRNIIPKYIADQRGLMYLEPDLVIGPYSDVFTNMKRYEGGPYRTFAIDAAILKACKPVPDEQGIRILKQKYNIQTNKPIFTIGFYPYGDDHKELDDIINSTINSTQIVIVATGDTSVKEHYLNNIDKDKIIEVVGRGMLSELYAISDISLSANHTIRYNSQLKNFFEMTQGGPTFMVPTTQNKQYGYKHFVEQGYVIECRNVRSMINKINKHLKNITPEKTLKHRENRIKFTEMTRKQHLPKILQHIKEILYNGDEKEIFRYQHPESNWIMHNREENEYIDVYENKYERVRVTY